MYKRLIAVLAAVAMFLFTALPCFALNCPVCTEEMYFDDMDGLNHCGYCGYVASGADNYVCPNCTENGFLSIIEYDNNGEPYLVSCNNCGYEGYYDMSLYIYCVICHETSVEDYGGAYYCYGCGAEWYDCPNCENGAIVSSISPYCTECYRNEAGDYHPAYYLGYQSGTVDEATLNAAKQEGYNEGYIEGHIAGFTGGSSHGYDLGFDEGRRVGEELGYEEGYNQAFTESNINGAIFRNATYSARVYYRNASNVVMNRVYDSILVDYGVQTVSFGSFLDNLLLSIGDEYLDEVYITLTWSEEDAFLYSAFPLYIDGDSDISSATATSATGRVYNLDAAEYAATDGGGSRIFRVLGSDVESNFYVRSFTLQVGRAADLLDDFSLYSYSESYTKGYAAGYDIGSNEGEGVGYIKGFTNGMEKGFADGKSEGLQLSETGGWRQLIAAVVEAPINTFQSLFNFEILGMNMQAVFGSFLALCVLVIVLKKVLL